MKRIERTTSRTAAMTCSSRAASFLETNPHYHCNDDIAVKILPHFLRLLFYMPVLRRYFLRILAPMGIFEYVIARTKYIDEVYEKALIEGFDQILIFGAGYDSRALRFRAMAQRTRIFELDEPHTQTAKIRQFQKRGLSIPSNVHFISIDLEKESLRQKLDSGGFEKSKKTLFILEGVLMYLISDAVHDTFETIQAYAGSGSRAVFDYIRASVLRHENMLYGEPGIVKAVSKAGEKWQFGFEPDEVDPFAEGYGFNVTDHKCVHDLEKAYFQDEDGQLAGRVNGTHCIVTLDKR
ncbi:MAG: class I SAM-dependent methyltransferase [Deltaproteobacteria bacterium]|nr:class I SAM-dependent methyltransferase [Deltaproteobacteria bacterium]